MPMKWDPIQDQKLLLLTLEHYKIDSKKLAESWTKKYGLGVTDRAIAQHLTKLAKDIGGSSGSEAGGTGRKSATATPSKPRVQNKSPTKGTPKSTGKRPQTSMSDEDDSEDERKVNNEESPSKRIKTERRSKTPKSYIEPAKSDADDETLVQHANGLSVAGASGDVENGDNGEDEHAYLDAASDVSDFHPEAGFH